MVTTKVTTGKSGDSLIKQIAVGLSVTLGATLITEIAQVINGVRSAVINIGEWDNAYNNINKMLYSLNPNIYIKHRTPTTNKDFFELSENISYFLRLDDKNYLRVETYRDKAEGAFYAEHRIKITFYGKQKYQQRERFLKAAMKISDESHIRIQYLNGREMSCDVIPHSFDNLILDDDIKKRIINGLTSWNNSEDWYAKHQLVHKIGVFLYGKPGTGKSTVVKAISTMFDNAPILTINMGDIMQSISEILKMRKKYDGTIIVLIEDFDMFFKSRAEIENIELDIEQKNTKAMNQNAIFQLLDGVYSTENTIYIATTNYKERIDEALIRYGRFDIQEELGYFSRADAEKCVGLLGYDADILDEMDLEYPVQPSFLQSKVMEYRANENK